MPVESYDKLYPSLYPVLGLQTRGMIGKDKRHSDYTPRGWWIHKEYKQFKVVTKYYYPYNPQTIGQQNWRNFFAYAVANWQGFDPATKNYYNQLKRPKYMLGYNRYLSMYLEAVVRFVYHFSCSISGPTDPGGVWYPDDSLPFDGDIETYAGCQDEGDENTNYLAGVGTSSPLTGPDIQAVKARIYGLSDIPGGYAVGLGDWSEVLGSDYFDYGGLYLWSPYITLDIPPGGWTWEKIKNLQVRFWAGADSFMSYFLVSKAEVLVEI